MHEAQMHKNNSFITLTYEESPGTLILKDFQDFMKRLRKTIKPNKIRFYHCGEYGENLQRPHYHALIFGYDFPDKYLYTKNLYRSDQLESVWKHGFSTIGELNYETAGYVARYVMKKINGDPAIDHYGEPDLNTGEIMLKKAEYSTMSRRPGLGKSWYEKYKTDLFPDNFVVIKGKKMPVPSYYQHLLREEDSELHISMQDKAKKYFLENRENSTPERLLTRELCKTAQIQRLTRDYETS